ncbi:putative monooxygenase p33MONOX [Etheostoma cragini]|uniref:putative monooxygenase p33MONOX n=1 Tax=Etheostoma cragini TaxID=417921 RepID=UPI00155E44E6|nr:putative monooxygenase p33MONOX [Etheostoma cragini]
MSGSGDLPALEGSGMGGMKLPVGMTRRALSYDDNLEAPMSTPPHDISMNKLWRRPVIPERKFNHLAEEDESGAASRSTVMDSAPSRSSVVVKTKASSIIMNSLITSMLHLGWFGSTSSDVSSSSSSVELAGGDMAVERWNVFGPRPLVQKSTSDIGSDSATAGGFALQAYRGAQKPTAMEVMKSQATRLADHSAAQTVAPPKMEIPTVDGRREAARPHKLKPRDMNVLTPSGF